MIELHDWKCYHENGCCLVSLPLLYKWGRRCGEDRMNWEKPLISFRHGLTLSVSIFLHFVGLFLLIPTLLVIYWFCLLLGRSYFKGPPKVELKKRCSWWVVWRWFLPYFRMNSVKKIFNRCPSKISRGYESLRNFSASPLETLVGTTANRRLLFWNLNCLWSLPNGKQETPAMEFPVVSSPSWT